MTTTLTPQEVYEKLLNEDKILTLQGRIQFTLGDVNIIVKQKDVVGNIIQEWLEGWLSNRNIAFSRNENTQMPPDLFLNLTANDYWYFLTRIYDLEASQVEERLINLMATFDLTESRYNLISSFSHGMRQKVVVIGALLVNPQIWVLDEPLTGLDPQASYDLKEAMRNHAKEGNSVLFSTHVLSVAEQLCDRIAILKKGKLIFQGSLAELKSQYPDKDLETIYLEMAGRKIEEV